MSFDRFSHPITLFAEAPGLNCPTFHHCLDLATIGMTEFVRFSIYGGPAIASCASSRFRLTSDAITALHVPKLCRLVLIVAMVATPIAAFAPRTAASPYGLTIRPLPMVLMGPTHRGLLSGLEPRHDEKGTAYRDNVFQGGDHEVGSLEGAYQTCANLVTRKRAGDSARHTQGGAQCHGLRP